MSSEDDSQDLPLSQTAEWECAGCGERNQSAVDISGGSRQTYVEDCEVCCRPNVLTIEHDAEAESFHITAVLES